MTTEFAVKASQIARLHGLLHVEGWTSHPDDYVTDIRPVGPNVLKIDVDLQIPEGGIVAAESFLRFRVRFALGREDDHRDVRFEFRTKKRRKFSIPLNQLIEAERPNDLAKLEEQFRNELRPFGRARVLDIGGRDRSDIDHSMSYSEHEVTVLDIIGGGNVDIVGDAHELSQLLPAQSFEAALSLATFEHLLMPWKVVLGLNHVLVPGGIAYIVTHQTIGLHDQPTDFWRYSDTAWPALFNAWTGFEILGKAMDDPRLILPVIHPGLGIRYEDAVGYYASGVLVRRTSDASVSWPVPVDSALAGTYPE